MSNEPTLVVGIRVESSPDVNEKIPGTEARTCSACDAPTWLAPSGQHHVDYHGGRLVCLECADLGMRAEPFPEQVRVGVLPGSVRELLESLRKETDDGGDPRRGGDGDVR